MGWWSIADEQGGINWNQSSSPIEMYNGDGPADIMGVALDESATRESILHAIDKIRETYVETWQRQPYPAELRAVVNFVACTSNLDAVALALKVLKEQEENLQ